MNERAFTEESFQQFLKRRDAGWLAQQGERQAVCAAAADLPGHVQRRYGMGRVFGGRELEAFTAVHIGLTAMIEAGYDRFNPYCSGIVKLAEGPSISAQILGVDHPLRKASPLARRCARCSSAAERKSRSGLIWLLRRKGASKVKVKSGE